MLFEEMELFKSKKFKMKVIVNMYHCYKLMS